MTFLFLSHDSRYNGGAQKCLVDLLQGLKATDPDCSIYVVFPTRGDLIEVCEPYMDGYQIIRSGWWLRSLKKLGLGSRLHFYLKTIKSTAKMLRYIRYVKPDCAVTNTIVMPHLAFACKLAGVRHYWFIHEVPFVTWKEFGFVFSWPVVARMIASLSERILVTSEYARNIYKEWMDGAKLLVLTQSVTLPPCLDVDVELVCSDDYTLLLVGAYDSNKGQLELLEAVAMLKENGTIVRCCLVGSDYGGEAACRAYIRDHALEQQVILAPFSDRVAGYYQRADVLVACSVIETFSRVTIEAQQCGLPVILSNVGAHPERIRDGVDGLLYRKGDVVDLAAKIKLLADPAVREQFRDQVRKIDFSVNTPSAFSRSFERIVGGE